MAASGSNTARVYVVQGRHRISVPMAIASNTIVDVADDRSLGANDVTITTGRSLTKSGKGTLSVARVRGGLLTVNGGTLAVAPDGGAAGLSIVNGLNVAGTPGARTSTLDLADNDLLVDYATAGTIERDVRELVRDGRLSGFGITSLRTEQDDMILAVADNAQLQRPSWLGQTIDATTIIGAYTFFGDANLDGMVTTDDYVAVDLNLGTGDAWVEGDFDLNGSVTTDDYVVIDLNLGKGTSTPAAWASQQSDMIGLHAAQFGEAYVTRLTHVREHGWTVTPVPEPGPFGLLVTAAAGLANRRRKPE
jgi:hypothetical protein